MLTFLKKNLAFLLVVLLCLSLTACGGDKDVVVGNDWRVTGVVRDSGTITRDGEDTTVLVCVHAENANFYYDTEDQVLFDSVDYPTTIESDAWEAFQGIGFADLNGDGNSDVTMNFNDGGTELVMVWFWDTESEQFVYQPDESWLGEDEDLGDLVTDDSAAVPVLMCDALPVANMENLQSETYEDGTYYYMDITEDYQITVVNAVLQSHFEYDVQTIEGYLTDCALTVCNALTYDSLTVEGNDAYTEMMSYPVYIVTFTTGGNEDAREWTVFAMDTDRYTYLYGLCVSLDTEEDVKSVYQDIFAGLYLSDGE